MGLGKGRVVRHLFEKRRSGGDGDLWGCPWGWTGKSLDICCPLWKTPKLGQALCCPISLCDNSEQPWGGITHPRAPQGKFYPSPLSPPPCAVKYWN